MKDLLTTKLGLRPDEFLGKTAVITGAGRGIGLQTARAFACLGGRVVIAEWDETSGRAAEGSIRDEGGDAVFILTDVSSEESVRSLRSTIERVDVLVNNAIRCPVKPFLDTDLEEWNRVIRVNLGGTYLTCKVFLPEMLVRGSGVVLNMVSMEAMPGLSAYIASKQGIVGLSKTLALEVAQSGVQVIPFGPGMVDTPGIREVSLELAPRLGMSRDQFLNLSLHAAYDGLMPAEHAGAATVFLALRLAGEYHGQDVNGYEVLERAGLIGKTVVPDSDHEDLGGGIGAYLETLDELQRILEETGQEFARLPIFVRPIARSGFKTKSGKSLENWSRDVIDLRSGKIPAGMPAALDRLANYYEGVPSETARFTRDSEFLTQIAATCQKRIRVIRKLQESLPNR